jgi:hypothetical protein
MKKLFFVCMTVSLLATSCDWFSKKEPQDDPEIVTNDDNIVEDTLVSTNDSPVLPRKTALLP